MLNIRPHARADIKYRVKWLNNNKVNIFAVDEPNTPTTLELQTAWFDQYESLANKEFFTIEIGGVPIGFMGLSNIDREIGTAKLFIMIGEDDFRGKSFGQQSMDWLINYVWQELGLKHIRLEVNAENLPAIKLYHKLGFENISEEDGLIEMILNR